MCSLTIDLCLEKTSFALCLDYQFTYKYGIHINKYGIHIITKGKFWSGRTRRPRTYFMEGNVTNVRKIFDENSRIWYHHLEEP